MPCERIVLLPYNGENFITTVYAGSDAKAVTEAIHRLEKREGKMRGSIKINIEDVLIKLK